MELQLSAMIDVVRPHRANDGDVVDAAADVRPPVADLDAALTALLVTDLQRVDLRKDFALVGRGGSYVRVQILLIQHVAKRGFSNRLSGVLVEHRLRIEALQVTCAANHEQPDDAFHLRREVRSTIGRRPARCIVCQSISMQHRPEREACETHAEVREKGSPGNAAAGISVDIRHRSSELLGMNHDDTTSTTFDRHFFIVVSFVPCGSFRLSES
jgi:hypothetical protein